MASVSSGFKCAAGRLIVLSWLLLCPAAAFAHKLYVYPESIEGATIHGRAYFAGDVPAQECDVIVRDASGQELGRTTTDDKGHFTCTAPARVDLVLVAATPDGHSGTYTIHASELPDSLPSRGPAVGGSSPIASQAADRAGEQAATAGKENELAKVREQLAEVDTQLKLLRRQVSDSDERLRFRDLLGGVGFILGLTGVAFYIKARGKIARPIPLKNRELN